MENLEIYDGIFYDAEQDKRKLEFYDFIKLKSFFLSRLWVLNHLQSQAQHGN